MPLPPITIPVTVDASAVLPATSVLRQTFERTTGDISRQLSNVQRQLKTAFLSGVPHTTAMTDAMSLATRAVNDYNRMVALAGAGSTAAAVALQRVADATELLEIHQRRAAETQKELAKDADILSKIRAEDEKAINKVMDATTRLNKAYSDNEAIINASRITIAASVVGSLEHTLATEKLNDALKENEAIERNRAKVIEEVDKAQKSALGVTESVFSRNISKLKELKDALDQGKINIVEYTKTAFKLTGVGDAFNKLKLYIGGAVAFSLYQAAQFEGAMRQLYVSAGLMNSLSYDEAVVEIHNLAGQYHKSSNEIVKTLSALQNTAIPVAKSAELLGQAFDLARLTGMESDRAIVLLADTLGGLGLVAGKSGEEIAKHAEHLNDVFVRAVQNSGGSIEQFANSLKDLSPYLRAFGSDVEHAVSTMALFQQMGYSSQQAGKMVQDSYTGIISSIENYEMQWLRIMNFDPMEGMTGTYKNMEDIMGALTDKLSGMTFVQQKATLSQLGFNAAHAKSILLQVEGEQQAKKLAAAIANGDKAAKHAKAVQDGYSKSAAMLRKTLDEVALVMGEQLVPVLQSFLPTLLDIIKNVLAFVNRNKETIKVLIIMGSVVTGVVFALKAFNVAIIAIKMSSVLFMKGLGGLLRILGVNTIALWGYVKALWAAFLAKSALTKGLIGLAIAGTVAGGMFLIYNSILSKVSDTTGDLSAENENLTNSVNPAIHAMTDLTNIVDEARKKYDDLRKEFEKSVALAGRPEEAIALYDLELAGMIEIQKRMEINNAEIQSRTEKVNDIKKVSGCAITQEIKQLHDSISARQRANQELEKELAAQRRMYNQAYAWELLKKAMNMETELANNNREIARQTLEFQRGTIALERHKLEWIGVKREIINARAAMLEWQNSLKGEETARSYTATLKEQAIAVYASAESIKYLQLRLGGMSDQMATIVRKLQAYNLVLADQKPQLENIDNILKEVKSLNMSSDAMELWVRRAQNKKTEQLALIAAGVQTRGELDEATQALLNQADALYKSEVSARALKMQSEATKELRDFGKSLIDQYSRLGPIRSYRIELARVVEAYQRGYINAEAYRYKIRDMYEQLAQKISVKVDWQEDDFNMGSTKFLKKMVQLQKQAADMAQIPGIRAPSIEELERTRTAEQFDEFRNYHLHLQLELQELSDKLNLSIPLGELARRMENRFAAYENMNQNTANNYMQIIADVTRILRPADNVAAQEFDKVLRLATSGVTDLSSAVSVFQTNLTQNLTDEWVTAAQKWKESIVAGLPIAEQNRLKAVVDDLAQELGRIGGIVGSVNVMQPLHANEVVARFDPDTADKITESLETEATYRETVLKQMLAIQTAIELLNTQISPEYERLLSEFQSAERSFNISPGYMAAREAELTALDKWQSESRRVNLDLQFGIKEMKRVINKVGVTKADSPVGFQWFERYAKQSAFLQDHTHEQILSLYSTLISEVNASLLEPHIFSKATARQGLDKFLEEEKSKISQLFPEYKKAHNIYMEQKKAHEELKENYDKTLKSLSDYEASEIGKVQKVLVDRRNQLNDELEKLTEAIKDNTELLNAEYTKLGMASNSSVNNAENIVNQTQETIEKNIIPGLKETIDKNAELRDIDAEKTVQAIDNLQSQNIPVVDNILSDFNNILANVSDLSPSGGDLDFSNYIPNNQILADINDQNDELVTAIKDQSKLIIQELKEINQKLDKLITTKGTSSQISIAVPPNAKLPISVPTNTTLPVSVPPTVDKQLQIQVSSAEKDKKNIVSQVSSELAMTFKERDKFLKEALVPQDIRRFIHDTYKGKGGKQTLTPGDALLTKQASELATQLKLAEEQQKKAKIDMYRIGRELQSARAREGTKSYDPQYAKQKTAEYDRAFETHYKLNKETIPNMKKQLDNFVSEVKSVRTPKPKSELELAKAEKDKLGKRLETWDIANPSARNYKPEFHQQLIKDYDSAFNKWYKLANPEVKMRKEWVNPLDIIEKHQKEGESVKEMWRRLQSEQGKDMSELLSKYVPEESESTKKQAQLSQRIYEVKREITKPIVGEDLENMYAIQAFLHSYNKREDRAAVMLDMLKFQREQGVMSLKKMDLMKFQEYHYENLLKQFPPPVEPDVPPVPVEPQLPEDIHGQTPGDKLFYEKDGVLIEHKGFLQGSTYDNVRPIAPELEGKEQTLANKMDNERWNQLLAAVFTIAGNSENTIGIAQAELQV
jgi:TP901 family phage tail tape measure protein